MDAASFDLLSDNSGLRSLVRKVRPLDVRSTAEEAQNFLQEEKLSFVPLVHEAKVIGLLSGQRLNTMLGYRGSIGLAVYGKRPIHEFMQASALIFDADTSLEYVFSRIAERAGDSFFDDVCVVDAQGGLVGTISTDVLVRLQHQVALQRAAKLGEANRELSIARDAALEGARAKVEFIANMSHEMRTPLHAVISLSGLLLDHHLDTEQKEFVRTIRTASDNLLQLINEILDFSKVESGKMDLECHPFSLRECLESSLDLVAPRAREKGLELCCLIPPGLPHMVLGDMTRIRQILVNLLANAVKFTEVGEVGLKVSLNADEGCAVLNLAVSDTGIGISPAGMSRLFQSFSQVDSSITRTHGGTGLGLAISQRLAVLMGGRLTVRSDAGIGSVFTLSLPWRPVPELPDEHTTPWLRNAALSPHKKVLALEDHPMATLALRQAAADLGVEVTVATSFAIARSMIENGESFDLVLIDHSVHVPHMALLAPHHASDIAPRLMLMAPAGCRVSDSCCSSLPVLSKPIKLLALARALGLVQGESTSGTETAHAPGTLSNVKVLVADDNPVNLRVADVMLQKLGIRPVLVSNGQEAIQAFVHRDYDVVLMDVQMPELDGASATRELRRTLTAARQPVIIAMTASGEESNREECFAAGMDDFIVKPVRLESLRHRLHIWHASERLKARDRLLTSE